jgi:microcystin-dependent protein
LPSDSNGVYSLPTGYLAVTGEVIQASQHNPPLEDLATAMSARLMRTGAAPMTGPIKVVDGSVGSPAVQFANGSSTGLYKTTNGIGVSIGGTKVAEFVAGGLVSGARWIGELVPYSGLTAPALTVFPYGQTLSRTTYADLWAFAQTEIAAGNTFYNNGNGSTTFGIGDLRGRVVAGADAMGGVAAGRLTDVIAGIDGVGDAGGAQTRTLVTANLPPYTPTVASASVSVTSTVSTVQNDSLGNVSSNFGGGATDVPRYNPSAIVSTGSASITMNAQGGTSTPVVTVQPTIICNYLLFAGA